MGRRHRESLQQLRHLALDRARGLGLGAGAAGCAAAARQSLLPRPEVVHAADDAEEEACPQTERDRDRGEPRGLAVELHHGLAWMDLCIDE